MLLYTHKVAVSGRVYLWVFAIVFPAFPQLFQLSISSKKSVPPAAACRLVRVNVHVVIPGS